MKKVLIVVISAFLLQGCVSALMYIPVATSAATSAAVKAASTNESISEEYSLERTMTGAEFITASKAVAEEMGFSVNHTSTISGPYSNANVGMIKEVYGGACTMNIVLKNDGKTLAITTHSGGMVGDMTPENVTKDFVEKINKS